MYGTEENNEEQEGAGQDTLDAIEFMSYGFGLLCSLAFMANVAPQVLCNTPPLWCRFGFRDGVCNVHGLTMW